MTQRIIGIVGLKGSGKSTVRKYLYHKYGFHSIPFAGPLKDMLRTLGLSDEQINGDLKETPSDLLGGKTPRWAMQTLGTEWGRNLIDPDIWVNAWQKAAQPYPQVVVDDVRFPNEHKRLLELKANLIRVERVSVEQSGDLHESERYAAKIQCDHIVTNNGTVEQLHRLTDEAVYWFRNIWSDGRDVT